MSIVLPKDKEISGFSALKVRDVLRMLQRGNGSPGYMMSKGALFPDRATAAIAYEECLDRGLIAERNSDTGSFDFDGLTDLGRSLAHMKGGRRATLANAEARLDEFLKRIEVHNHDKDAIDLVDQIWLFGSVLRREATVGDIDLRYTTSRSEMAESLKSDGWTKRTYEIAHARGFTGYSYDAYDWLQRHALFGERRHPLLAGVSRGTQDLVDLGVPCRLIYDRSRGGRVDDPILERHPDSTGRSNTISQNFSHVSEFPFVSDTIRPMDADWLATHWDGTISPYHLQQKNAYRPLLGENRLRAFSVNSSTQRPAHWRNNGPAFLKGDLSEIDGRNRAVLCVAVDDYNGLALEIHRTIEVADGIVTLRAELSDFASTPGATAHNQCVRSIAGPIALLLATDLNRLLRHTIETQQEVHLELDTRKLRKELATWLYNLTFSSMGDNPDWFGPEAARHLEARPIAAEFSQRVHYMQGQREAEKLSPSQAPTR